jgi:hypothetical protein
MQSSHLPNSSLELPCVLSHPSFPKSLDTIAKLNTTSKGVAVAAAAACCGQLHELPLKIISSCKAQQVSAWMPSNAGLLQGVRTLCLQMDRPAIDGCSRTEGSTCWSEFSSRVAGLFRHSTVAAAAAAAILQSMPKSLSKVNLQLQSEASVAAVSMAEQECALLCAQLAALEQPAQHQHCRPWSSRVPPLRAPPGNHLQPAHVPSPGHHQEVRRCCTAAVRAASRPAASAP